MLNRETSIIYSLFSHSDSLCHYGNLTAKVLRELVASWFSWMFGPSIQWNRIRETIASDEQAGCQQNNPWWYIYIIYIYMIIYDPSTLARTPRPRDILSQGFTQTLHNSSSNASKSLRTSAKGRNRRRSCHAAMANPHRQLRILLSQWLGSG